MKRLALLVCMAMLGLALATIATPVASAATALSGPFHTAGNQILDASNQPVRFRGLDRVMARTTAVTEDEIDHAKQWGANIVRLTLDEDQWTQLCPTTSYDPSTKSDLDNIVNWVTSRGMVALLELASNPRFTCDPQAASNKRMADYPGSVIFWQSVAKRYMGNPLVAFELYNEPHDITDSVWLNGGTLQDGLIFWQAAGMQQLYNAIRGVGAANLIWVSGTHWAATPPALTVSGTNIVYGGHMYTCPNQPPPNCTQTEKIGPGGLVSVTTPMPNPYDPTELLNRWTTFAAVHPFVITEFGWPAPYDGTYNANLISGAESRGYGWIAYTWTGTPEGKFNLLLNAGVGANYDPNKSGVPVKEGLALNP